MRILHRVEEILSELRPAFSRQAAFEWFVLLMWGVLLCTQDPAVTSYMNAIGLSEYYYHHALHWFHSQSWSVVKLSQTWGQWLGEHKNVHRPCGKQMILLSTDITLSGSEIISAYGWRFKIEVTFRTLIQLLWGFSYRFWMKNIPPTPRWPKNLIIDKFPAKNRPILNLKMAAMERFVNLNAIGLGILQLLSLEMSVDIWQSFPRWFRTLPKHGYPTEQIVRLTLQDMVVPILAKCRPGLLLHQFIARRPPRGAKPLTERFIC